MTFVETVSKKQKLYRNSIYIFKILIILICSLLAPLFSYKGLNILFMIPLLSFCFFTGIDYFLFSIVGILISSIITYNSNTYFSAIAICLYFIIYFLFKLFHIKSSLNHTFSSTFAIFFSYLAFQIINHSINYLELAIVLTIACLISVLFALIIHTFPLRSIIYQNENSLIISCLLLSLYLSFFKVSSVSMIIIRLLILICAIKVSIQATLAFSFSLYLAFFLLNYNYTNELFIMILPAIIVGFMKENKKWLITLLYLISSIIFIFFINGKDSNYLLLEAIITTILMIFLPSFIFKPVLKVDNYYEMYLQNQKDIENKLEEFSLLFDSLAKQFIKSKQSRILEQANVEVFDKLCANCFKNQFCHQNGNHLLMNYVKDGIMNNLNENKINYVKKNCLKADAYLKLIDRFMQSYLLKHYENDDLCILKDVVSNQFLGFSKIMNSYKEHLKEDKMIVANMFYKNIKQELECYNYDVLYVNNFSTINQYCFDLAIANCSIKEIKNNVMPTISRLLNCYLEIIDIHYNNLVSNYVVLSIQETKKQTINYCYKQNGKATTYCGDSLQCIDYQNKFYLAISDGMGNGIEANEESKFTLDVLLSTIKTGLTPSEGITISNSLLKLKNQYDTYTTIDLIEIDKTTLIAKFYKAGAFLSLIRHDNEIKVVENYALPIGIVDKITPNVMEYQLQPGDTIYMMSDGLIDEYNEDIKNIILNNNEENSNIAIKELYDKFMELKQTKDDVTFVIIDIKKD